MAFQQLPEEPHRSATIPPRLDQYIEDVAVLVHRAPELLLATVERDEELVEMPRVTLLTAPAPKRAGIARTERQTPLADRLVGDRDAALGEEVLNIPKAESESVIKPNGVADDLRRKPVAVIAR